MLVLVLVRVRVRAKGSFLNGVCAIIQRPRPTGRIRSHRSLSLGGRFRRCRSRRGHDMDLAGLPARQERGSRWEAPKADLLLLEPCRRRALALAARASERVPPLLFGRSFLFPYYSPAIWPPPGDSAEPLGRLEWPASGANDWLRVSSGLGLLARV